MTDTDRYQPEWDAVTIACYRVEARPYDESLVLVQDAALLALTTKAQALARIEALTPFTQDRHLVSGSRGHLFTAGWNAAMAAVNKMAKEALLRAAEGEAAK